MDLYLWDKENKMGNESRFMNYVDVVDSKLRTMGK